jgi:HAMP domain-containing protein
VIVAVALVASLVVARSMVRPLRRLRSAALGVAQTQLPAAIEQLRTTNTGELDIRVEPVGVSSRDEIGEVAGAFDTVHQEAVRLATEQAALRKSINDMFVNLARRNQTLIDRQLNLIEDLERDTDDPDEMAELFRLDHLATRMRRNQENLLVLASAEPAKRWSDPVALAHLLQEAMGEVEDFTRVELLTNDDAMVVGYATSDIVHLLAELIENATMFSPPHTPVRIATQAAANGYLIEIEDQGTGMSDHDLLSANERLANPPEIDFALSRRLGFFVVGRLARRHGIRVQLRHSWYGGVTALVLIPGALFMPGTIATPVGVAGNRRGMPELSPASVVTGDVGGNGRRPWTGDTAPTAPWAARRGGSGTSAGDGAGPAAPAAPLPAGGAPVTRDRGRTATEPPSPGRPAFTPRVSDAARVGSRTRARASAGDRPHDPAEPGGRAGEGPRHRLGGGGRRGDPLASYQTGLVQGRVTGDLEGPPPLSPPSSQFRNDDQPPPR